MASQQPKEPNLIQPVESPVICVPYMEPTHYWDYNRETGVADKVEGRRPSYYWYKDETDTRKQQLSFELEEQRRDMVMVNKLRRDVKRWRESQWEGATNVTKDLLRHWTRPDRQRRFFFCQIEAVETLIFLCEIRGLRKDGQRNRPRWNPDFTDEDFKTLNDGALTRMCTKMCTGSGKTVVMGMMISWAFCNRARVPSDERFPKAALICCPNLTIKERLQVLRTDSSGGDYYTEFDMVPPQYRDLLRSGKVAVSNWHNFAPESPHSEGGKSYPVVQKGAESDEAFARNRLGELYEMGPIMVLNDEGHHAYRPAPTSEELKGDAKEQREEATVWVQGLDKINKACGIKICVDVSATPFYLKGSGYPEGEPFPWIVSDFSLVDGIESGITKIPRLPVSDTTGRPDPKYFKLWKNITKDLAASERLSNGRPKPEVVWRKAEDALVQLAGEYEKQFNAIQEASDLALKSPPVMILVCDNTNIAQLFFENISGQTEVEDANIEPDDDEDSAEDEPETKKKKARKRTVYGTGKVFPELFQNAKGQIRTIAIDSKRLEKVESEDPAATKDKAAKALRAIVNSVGRPGQPGQDVRCVVSVSMLTEGWDANNVTHILGLRAFGSQLLCEQVVGRGLRRMNYTPDPDTGLLPEEFVDVYGIPFSVIPYKGKTSSTPADKPVNHIKAMPERSGFEIRFPNVEGYVYALNKPLIRADIDGMEKLIIEPESTPTATFVKVAAGYAEGTASGGGIGDFIEHNRQQYYSQTHLQAIEFEIARQVVAALVGEGAQAPVGGSARMRGFARHQLYPQVLRYIHQYVESKVMWRGADPCELGLEKYVQRIKERMLDAIEPDDSLGEAPLMPLLNRFKPIGSTGEIDFTTTRPVHSSQRSHVNAVVLDSTWEQSAAFFIEQRHDLTPFYVRNERPFVLIPYDYEGVSHFYEPDYLVRLNDGRTLILEVKGMESDQTQAKHQAAKRWISAVNNWGKLGQWEFEVCRDPQLLTTMLERLMR
jgi:type III restriction enzyme